MDDLVCPACGETEKLNGERRGDLIHITCESCQQAWDRDPSPRCPTCEGDDLEAAIKAVVEKSRGSQLSIVATQVVHLCRVCDEAVLAVYKIGRSPLMPDELPTT
ncbi:MAG: hypothetical protein ACI8Y4_001579 [Candidatus Poriferisodalaceae bacterium]|jgi:hypothetical protein